MGKKGGKLKRCSGQHESALASHSSSPSLQSFSVDETHRCPKLSPTSWESCRLRAHCCLQPPCQPCGQPQISPSKGCGPSSQRLLLLLRNRVWYRCAVQLKDLSLHLRL